MRQHQSQAFADQFEYYLSSVKGPAAGDASGGRNPRSQSSQHVSQKTQSKETYLELPPLRGNTQEGSSPFRHGFHGYQAYGPYGGSQGISYTLPASDWGGHRDRGLPPPHPRPASLRRAHNTPTVWNYSQGKLHCRRMIVRYVSPLYVGSLISRSTGSLFWPPCTFGHLPGPALRARVGKFSSISSFFLNAPHPYYFFFVLLELSTNKVLSVHSGKLLCYRNGCWFPLVSVCVTFHLNHQYI